MKKTFFVIVVAMCLYASRYGLSTDRVVTETFPRTANTDPDWWVNSGAYFSIKDGVGTTIQGDLPTSDRFYGLYRQSSFVDTDGGLHPQNLFRLVTNKSWTNFIETMYFRINKINMSASTNRNASNGVLFFLRYADSDHLYYAGIRVDGDSVIKKKNGNVNAGGYSTMNQQHVYPSPGGYNAGIPEQSNFIPTGKWIGLRAQIQNTAEGNVSIQLWMDQEAVDHWVLVTSATDDGHVDGSSAFLAGSQAGIRTDFMDVEFHSYDIQDLNLRRRPPHK